MTRGEWVEGLPDELMDAAAGLEAILGPATPQAVACGIVVRTWRECLEGHHGLLSDAEMAWTNISTTRSVLPYCDVTGVDWPAVRLVLLDPERRVLPGRAAAAVLGDAWPQFRRSLDQHVDVLEAYPGGLMACFASMLCPSWWGMPGWPTRVVDVVASGAVSGWSSSTATLVGLLVDDPTALPFDVWEQIVHALRE